MANEIEYAMLEDQLNTYEGLLVVTRGPDEAIATRGGAPVGRATPPVVDAIDTVGAGDAFCGSLVDALARGLTIDASLQRSCLVGALAATRSGAQPSLPTAFEVANAR